MGRTELFHGTARDVADVIRPVGRGKSGSVWGSMGYRYGQRADEHAFATEDEHEAWFFADRSQYPTRAESGGVHYTNAGPPTGRSRVYVVGPAADQRPGAYHPDHPKFKQRGIESHGEHVSRTGFPVVDRIDTKPGHQGTFPIDWRPYAQPGTSFDVNHPHHDAVFFGHRPAPGAVHAQGVKEGWMDPPKSKPVPELAGQQHLTLGPQFAPKEA